MRKEVVLDFSDGLTAAEARVAAKAHLERFADPGFTGTITLECDPLDVEGNPVPRQAVHAGRSLLVRGLFGMPEGVLVHVTESSCGATSSTLTFDTLFRDHLTVDQVRKRGRDALVPYRMLSTTGTYSPRVPDLLFPWSYASGSGMIPQEASPLFTTWGPSGVSDKVAARAGLDPQAVPFPWTDYTTKYPPRTHPEFYIRIPPANRLNADRNWANKKAWTALPGGGFAFAPYPVRFSAAGKIRLVQIAAYDRNGMVKRVPFHVSLYYSSGVSYTSMPMIPGDATNLVTKAAVLSYTAGSTMATLTGLPKDHMVVVGDVLQIADPSNYYGQPTGQYEVAVVTGTTATVARTGPTTPFSATRTVSVHVYDSWSKVAPYQYTAGQHYPFFPNAFENIDENGRLATNENWVTAGGSMIAGWGTYYQKAGFWPGASSDSDDKATGLLVDESGFSFDFRTSNEAIGVTGVDQRLSAEENMRKPERVTGYVMIYCDADAAADTYFLGRLFREEFSE